MNLFFPFERFVFTHARASRELRERSVLYRECTTEPSSVVALSLSLSLSETRTSLVASRRKKIDGRAPLDRLLPIAVTRTNKRYRGANEWRAVVPARASDAIVVYRTAASRRCAKAACDERVSTTNRSSSVTTSSGACSVRAVSASLKRPSIGRRVRNTRSRSSIRRR